MKHDEMINVFNNLVRSRHSVRGFKPEAISKTALEQIFSAAQQAPSNCNTQPWQVHVVSAELKDTLAAQLTEAIGKGEFTMDFPYAGRYDNVYKERQYDAANQLYTAMGISREDKVARHEAFLRNFSFFGAPHVAFLFMHESFGLREAADVGMYAQNLMLSMAAHGVGSCPQTALGFHADLVREALAIPSSMKLLFGISFGYEDESDLANKARVAKAALAETVYFH